MNSPKNTLECSVSIVVYSMSDVEKNIEKYNILLNSCDHLQSNPSISKIFIIDNSPLPYFKRIEIWFDKIHYILYLEHFNFKQSIVSIFDS